MKLPTGLPRKKVFLFSFVTFSSVSKTNEDIFDCDVILWGFFSKMAVSECLTRYICKMFDPYQISHFLSCLIENILITGSKFIKKIVTDLFEQLIE